jgi:glycosyltransferase involved in cell wall biosynthesis
LLIIWGLISGSLLIALSFRQWRFAQTYALLRDVEPHDLHFDFPKVSLIVPACNEADTIGTALTSLLAMDYPNLELIVVNDRSTDSTSQVINKIRAVDPRVNLVEVKSLPDGWLGKLHAMESGVKAATGDWLLFSDADVHYAKDSLRKAVTFSIKDQLDFLAVVPSLRAEKFILRVAIAQFIQLAIYGIDRRKVQDRNSRNCVGGGAFNMVLRSAYERSKGFEWLKLDVIDDTGLAMVVKEAGAKCDLLGGQGEVELEWYPSFGAFVRGLEKNAFAIFQYSHIAVCLYGAISTTLSTNAWLQGFDLCAFGVFVISSQNALKRILPFSTSVVIFLPLTTLILPMIALRSALLFSWRGGINWRGTFYSRAALISNQKFKLFDILTKR